MPLHYRTCNLCEAMCGLVIDHENGKINSIKGDQNDLFSKGYICPKAIGLQDIYADPNRLKQPIKKVNGKWQAISWEAAFDEASEQLLKVREKYGPSALGIYQGNPTVHNYGSMLFARQFVRALGIKNKFSATSVDQLPHHLASQLMFGHALLIPIPDIDRTQHFLVLGANPVVSNGSLMTAPGMPKRIKALQQRGGKLIVIDPRKSETAQKADEHYFIQPGGDVFLLLGILKVIFQNKLDDPQQLTEHIKGASEVKNTILTIDLELVSKKTSISIAEIEHIATAFAQAEKAVCYGRMGVSVQEHGSLCQWLINLLNIVTGNFDRAGGALFTKPAVDLVKMNSPKGTYSSFNRFQSKVRGLPEFGGELPVVTMAEEILDAGDQRIRAMITSAGNPVLSTPNGQQLDKAFGQLDFMLSIDIYLNETTQHADLILPPTTGLETDHYDLIFNLFAVRNVSKYSEALFEPAENTKHDWEIFKALIERIQPAPSPEKQAEFKQITPQILLNQSLVYGPYGKKGMSLKHLKAHPHGVDLGSLQPSVPQRLFMPDHKIDLAPTHFIEGLQQLLNAQQSFNPHELVLISRRQLRSNNSWMHNVHRLVKGGDRCTLQMHPDDAAKRNVSHQQQVMIHSRVGKVAVKLEVTTDMMPGVVCLPHGWGHHRDGIQLDVAQQHAGVSINDLTDELLIDELSGNAALSGLSVQVEKI